MSKNRRANQAARAIEEALDAVDGIHVCNSAVAGDKPGEWVIWVQHPFKPTGLKKDLGRQFRITIREDEL